MKVFTILETSGQHGNIFVNEIVGGFKELEVYSLFNSLKESSFLFKFMRRFFGGFYNVLCLWKARKVLLNVDKSKDVFLSFGGGFANLYDGKTIIVIDDCNFSEEELNMINLKSVTAVIMTTDQMKNEYITKYYINKPIYVIPSGIDFDKIRKLPHDGFNVIYYGHIINDHDVKILNAISKEMSKCSDFVLHVAGSFNKGTSEMLDSKIRFHGHLSHDKISDLISIADLGLYIRNDSYNMSLRISIKVLEMMVNQLPIISNITRPIPAESGWTIDETEIPEKVSWSYKNKKKLKEFYNLNIEKYNTKNVINEYRNILKSSFSE